MNLANINKTHPGIFIEYLNKYIANQVHENVIWQISGLLAIDYNFRLQESVNIKKHANECAQRIQEYLQDNIVLEDEFSTTLSLFAAAISNFKNKKNKAYQELTAQISDAVIAGYFAATNSKNQKVIKQIIIEILNSGKGYDLLHFIQTEPQNFLEIVKTANEEHTITDKAKKIILNNTRNLMHLNSSIQSKKALKINLIEKCFCIIGASLTIATTLLLGSGVLLPIIGGSACVAWIKFGAKWSKQYTKPYIASKLDRNYSTADRKGNAQSIAIAQEISPNQSRPKELTSKDISKSINPSLHSTEVEVKISKINKGIKKLR